MKIDKETKLFFSISEFPGNFGATFFNYIFETHGINAIYKPLKLNRKYITYRYFEKFLENCKEMGVSGISVSMPFKKKAYSDCCISDSRIGEFEILQRIGNINTLIFKDDWRRPEGYNTDYIGFNRACHYILPHCKKAIIYGDGAVSDSISYVLSKNYQIEYLKVRRDKPYWLEENDGSFDFLINASPVGMKEKKDLVFTKKIVDRYRYIFDVVGEKEDTNLISLAKSLGKIFVKGSSMQIEGALEQARLYLNYSYIDEEAVLLKMKESGYL